MGNEKCSTFGLLTLAAFVGQWDQDCRDHHTYRDDACTDPAHVWVTAYRSEPYGHYHWDTPVKSVRVRRGRWKAINNVRAQLKRQFKDRDLEYPFEGCHYWFVVEDYKSEYETTRKMSYC